MPSLLGMHCLRMTPYELKVSQTAEHVVLQTSDALFHCLAMRLWQQETS